MTKNILAKFKKPLEESSKIVRHSRMSQEGEQEDWQHILRQCQMIESRKYSLDRSGLYKTVADNHELSRLLQKIPELMRQNIELKQKIGKVEYELERMKRSQQEQRRVSPRQEPLCSNEMEFPGSIIKILKDWKSMERTRKAKKYRRSSKETIKIVDSSLEENLSRGESAHRRERSAKRQSEGKKQWEREKRELILEKQLMQGKVEGLLEERRHHAADIDQIIQRFSQTLAGKQRLWARQEQFYRQKIQMLEGKIVQLQGENQIVKIQNQGFQQKLCNYEKATRGKQFSWADNVVPSDISNSLIKGLGVVSVSPQKGPRAVHFTYKQSRQ